MIETATVVMIEDSPSEAAITRAVLAREEYRVQIAPTGTAGIQVVKPTHQRPVHCDQVCRPPE